MASRHLTTWRVFFVFVLLLDIEIVVGQQIDSDDTKPVVTIRDSELEVAVLLDLSGSQQTLGEPAMNGFNLAMRDATATKYRIVVRPIDTRTDDDTTRAAAAETAKTVAVAAGFTNNESLLVAGPFFQQQSKPFLSIGATDPALPQVIGNSVFLACFGDNAQAAAAAEFAFDQFGDKAAILWDSTTPYTRSLPKYFRTRFEQLEGEIVMDTSYTGCDIKDLAQKIAMLPTQPAFVYLAAMPECAGELIASIRASGIDAPIIGGDGLDSPNTLKSENGPTNKVWFTTHAWLSATSGTPRAKAFVQRFKDVYGAPPSDAFAALGYDAANLLIDAIRRADSGTAKDIAVALASTSEFEGVTGTISFSEEEHVPKKSVWIIRIDAGNQSLAAALVPQSVPAPITSQSDSSR